MEKNRFSVIVTTYNRAGLLRLALRSLKYQSYKNFEVFIIDDASIDNTYEVCKEFLDEKKWYFIRLSENRGYPYAKNLAFKLCNSDYITFLDSDDIWLPDRLKEFDMAAKKNPEAGFIFSDGYILSGDIINLKMFSHIDNIPTGKVPASYAVSNKYLPYVTTNVAIKFEAIRRVGNYREDMRMLADTEYFVRVIKEFPVEVIYKPLSIYRINISENLQITRDWEKCIKESELSLLSAEPSENEYKEIMEFTYLQQANAMIRNGYGKTARKYLRKCSFNFKMLVMYFSTFMPVSMIFILKKIYNKMKKIYHPDIKSGEFKEINEFYKKISKGLS